MADVDDLSEALDALDAAEQDAGRLSKAAADEMAIAHEWRRRAEAAEARLVELSPAAWTEDDQELPEDAAIREAFPTRSGRHDLYGEAMRLVGAKRSKGALVALVTWLLLRVDSLAKDNQDLRESYDALRERLREKIGVRR